MQTSLKFLSQFVRKNRTSREERWIERLERVQASADPADINRYFSTMLDVPAWRSMKLGWRRHNALFIALTQISQNDLARLESDRKSLESARPEVGAAIMIANDIRTSSLSSQRVDDGVCAYGKQYLRTLHMASVKRFGLEQLGEAVQYLSTRYGATEMVKDNAGMLVRILSQSGKHVEAITLAEAHGLLDNGNKTLHLQFVKSQYSIGKYDEAQSFLTRLQSTYEPAAYFDLLVSLGDRVVTEKQTQWIKSYITEKDIPKDQVLRALPCLNRYGGLDTEFFEQLEVTGLSGEDRLELAIAFSENRQLKTLAFAQLGQNWSTLQDEVAEQSRLYSEFASSAPSKEFSLFTRQLRLIESAQHSYMLTETAFSQAYDLTEKLNARIRAGTPTSLVRIGDGEAAFLGRGQDHANQRNKMLSIWWGNESINLPDISRLEVMVSDAVLSADVIGLAPPWRIFDSTRYDPKSKSDHMELFSSALERIADLRKESLGEVTFTSAHFHQALLKWDLLQHLLKGVVEVSTISPHDISQELLKRLGITTRIHHPTPPERAFASRFTESSQSEQMYPDRMNSIINSLDVRPGEVFLVAAGFVSKHLCKVIKDRGGIGLDVGSVADYLKGHETRIYAQRENHINLHPKTFRDRKLPLCEIDSVATRKETEKNFCYSDMSGTRDILPLLRTDFFSDRIRQDMSSRLLVTGHPRCASGFVASFLSACDVKLGHERYARDGICSWLHACSDVASPWGDPRLPDESFPNVLAYARDPMSAMASIALENCQALSFRYRRFNIMRSFNVDITTFETPLARAVCSYIYWYKLVFEMRPAGVIRVESITEDVAKLQPFLASVIGNFDTDQVEAINVATLKRNDSQAKFTIQKPHFSECDWEQVPDLLIAELCEVATKLGYRETADRLIR